MNLNYYSGANDPKANTTYFTVPAGKLVGKLGSEILVSPTGLGILLGAGTGTFGMSVAGLGSFTSPLGLVTGLTRFGSICLV